MISKNMEEIWKDVVGYEGLYQVSNLGRVKSLKRQVMCGNKIITVKEKIIKTKESKGYIQIILHNNGKRNTLYIHRVVAMTFIPNPLCLEEVNHIDGDKQNNIVSNLEWCTPSENVRHAFANGLRTAPIHHCKSIEVYKYADKSFVGLYPSLHDAVRKLGLNIGHVWSVLHGKCRQTCGYYFKRVEDI